jgi:hypothetical protein
LTDFVCLYTYEFWLSLCKIVRSSAILLLPLFISYKLVSSIFCRYFIDGPKCLLIKLYIICKDENTHQTLIYFWYIINFGINIFKDELCLEMPDLQNLNCFFSNFLIEIRDIWSDIVKLNNICIEKR